MVLREGSDAPECLARLLVGTPGACAAAGRALAGWSCSSTIESVLAQRAAIELKARGVAIDRSPAARLDVLAVLLALARWAPAKPSHHEGNVRDMALNAVALVATALHVEAKGGRSREANAGGYVLSALMPAPHEVTLTGSLCSLDLVSGERLPVLFSGPRAPGHRWVFDGPDVGPDGTYKIGRAWTEGVMVELLAAVRADRAPRLALSPALTPTDELLGSVAASVALDADYLAVEPVSTPAQGSACGTSLAPSPRVEDRNPDASAAVVIDLKARELRVGEKRFPAGRATARWTDIVELAKARSAKPDGGWKWTKRTTRSRREDLRTWLDGLSAGMAEELIESMPLRGIRLRCVPKIEE